MWSWLFDKKPSDAQSTSGLSLEDDKLFEKNPPDVKLVYDIGGKIASGVFGTVYQVQNFFLCMIDGNCTYHFPGDS